MATLREVSPADVSDCDVTRPNSPALVLVIHTDEDWEIARECLRLAG